MPLEEMLRALEFEGVAECERIVAQGRARADKILEEAKAEADRQREERLAKTALALQLEQSKILKAARFAVKKEIIKAKEAAIEEVFRVAAQRLGSLRQSPRYKQIFERLTREALEGMTGQVRVRVDPQDADLAREVLTALGVDFTLEADGQYAGGLEVYAEDGRVWAINTIESRLEKARQSLKAEIADLLFA
ncbi:MAG: V-type ATP synthase subunit E [Bacillota bacterium]|nr:V-type ATP synthase subunit E [Bacillota bacterium]